MTDPVRKFNDGDIVAYTVDPNQPQGSIASMVLDGGNSLGERFYNVTFADSPEPRTLAEATLRLITSKDN